MKVGLVSLVVALALPGLAHAGVTLKLAEGNQTELPRYQGWVDASLVASPPLTVALHAVNDSPDCESSSCLVDLTICKLGLCSRTIDLWLRPDVFQDPEISARTNRWYARWILLQRVGNLFDHDQPVAGRDAYRAVMGFERGWYDRGGKWGWSPSMFFSDSYAQCALYTAGDVEWARAHPNQVEQMPFHTVALHKRVCKVIRQVSRTAGWAPPLARP